MIIEAREASLQAGAAYIEGIHSLGSPTPFEPLTRMLRFQWRRGSWLLSGALSRGAKSFVDVTLGAAALVALIPFFLVVAALIKLSDPGGPVLFWQTRVGKHGRHFAFPKFRSMKVDAEAEIEQLAGENLNDGSITFKMEDDPRVTRLGRVIRKASLDELPQLWCVLTGEMSLVGPRPPLPREVARYSSAQRRRLDVVPGLTCIWQVSGRSNIPFDGQVVMDVEYIETQSLWLDLKLLLKTIPAVLNGRGAY